MVPEHPHALLGRTADHCHPAAQRVVLAVVLCRFRLEAYAQQSAYDRVVKVVGQALALLALDHTVSVFVDLSPFQSQRGVAREFREQGLIGFGEGLQMSISDINDPLDLVVHQQGAAIAETIPSRAVSSTGAARSRGSRA